jgi:hypothetical protein
MGVSSLLYSRFMPFFLASPFAGASSAGAAGTGTVASSAMVVVVVVVLGCGGGGGGEDGSRMLTVPYDARSENASHARAGCLAHILAMRRYIITGTRDATNSAAPNCRAALCSVHF